jgi:hypothetical protein
MLTMRCALHFTIGVTHTSRHRAIASRSLVDRAPSPHPFGGPEQRVLTADISADAASLVGFEGQARHD